MHCYVGGTVKRGNRVSKFHIFSRSEKSSGDKIALRQTTNKQQTTTNTTDDHNSPSGFFQNPQANNNNGDKIILFLTILPHEIIKVYLLDDKLIHCKGNPSLNHQTLPTQKQALPDKSELLLNISRDPSSK